MSLLESPAHSTGVARERAGHSSRDATPHLRARSLARHRARRADWPSTSNALTPLNVPLDVESALRRH